ncbi:hypothetical protein GGTG_12675 [Gaeumannomyces tritici R3-111a-1]|uniref:Uncharacterized protein n=1 Tax=Gaeumannomyces tritici (strain R3-111a-1) TaxID=644352 RepID=J3PGP6_GAET3|nr:hypothetical protein GGTG_12675 [Gaeumannomyces tritici R3-111a-1]EJT69792.1 hypothetical protein GGTG_12675 [Gaeumannomyces tritici R3-111a-1]
MQNVQGRQAHRQAGSSSQQQRRAFPQTADRKRVLDRCPPRYYFSFPASRACAACHSRRLAGVALSGPGRCEQVGGFVPPLTDARQQGRGGSLLSERKGYEVGGRPDRLGAGHCSSRPARNRRRKQQRWPPHRLFQ